MSSFEATNHKKSLTETGVHLLYVLLCQPLQTAGGLTDVMKSGDIILL